MEEVMVEALIALVVAILILTVFKAPAWIIRIGSYGGLAFVLYVFILVLKFLIGSLRR
jgi:hypothetical protein